MKRITVFMGLFSALQVYAQTGSWTDTAARIENIFSRYKPNNPGIQVAVSRNGLLLFSKAWGMADLEHAVPLTTSSVTEAGSVSKQFTAAAILLLEQEGKLSLDDGVRKYIPELPEYERPVSIRQMMQHTSGLKDWGSIAAIGGWPRSTKTYSNEDALYIISRQKTLNNQPGDEFIYSNSNYNLFAIIVKRVSGMSLYDFCRKKIFDSAGMKHTEWRANFRKIVPNRAIAYSKGGEGYLTNMPNEYVYGNGGLLTTTEDLVKWNDYYAGGKLGNPSLLQKQITSGKLTNGIQHNYAAGLFIEKYRGLDLWTHNGATAGYRSNLDYFPSLGLSIAWLSNTSEFDGNPFNLSIALREIFVPKPPTETAIKQPPAITLDAEKLKTLTGWYRNSRDGSGINLFIKDALLNSNTGLWIKPVADNIFMVGYNKIEFLPGNQRIWFITPAKDSTLFTRMDSANINAGNLEEYTGEYYSDETETKFAVQAKNGKLVLLQKPSNEFVLKPTYKDGFESAAGPVWFERDKKKKIIQLKISVGRARNIRFDKMR
ncbi:MAG: beta-lactamase family protein [Ferruginibacter sp.]|nr:beta-lactamase family protein [Ferruginibacter sp.]